MLMTLEERWFFADDVAQLGSLGLAGFIAVSYTHLTLPTLYSV